MQFQLEDQPAKVTNYNARAERHGREEVPAADVKFETLVHSSLLDVFDKSFRPFLFRANDTAGDQAPLIDGDKLTGLDKPHLKPLESSEEYPGYRMEISSGLDLGEPLVIDEVKLGHWKFEPRKGGAVMLTFTASFKPDRVSGGVLSTSVKKAIHLTLRPPTVSSPQADLDV